MGNTTIKAILPPDLAIPIEACLTRTSNFKIYSFLLGISGWIMCILSTASVQWRLWHVQNITSIPSDIVWIGIWKVCSIRFGMDDDTIHCHIFKEKDPYIPMEIFLAQDLMTLAIILEALAILFLCFGFWNTYEEKECTRLTANLFFFGSIWNLISGILTLMPISLNMIAVLSQNNISFPAAFQLPAAPEEQVVGAALYFGLISAILQILSGLFIFIEECLIKDNQIHPGEKCANRAMTCPYCNSSVQIPMGNEFFIESVVSRKLDDNNIEHYTIPTGTVRSRTITSADLHL